MDMDELKEQSAHQQKLLKNYAKHMRIIEDQISSHGIYPPSTLIVQLEEYQEKIASINEIKQKIEASLQSIVQETSKSKIPPATVDVLIFAVREILTQIGRTEDFLIDVVSRLLDILTRMDGMFGNQRDYNRDFVEQFRLIQTFMEHSTSLMVNAESILYKYNEAILMIAITSAQDNKLLQAQIDELKQALKDKE